MGLSNLSLKGDVKMTRVPVIQRPVVRTFDDAVKYGTPLGMGRLPRFFGRAAALRKARWQERNAENFRRSLADQLRSERNALPNPIQAIGHLWLAKVHLNGDLEDFGLVSCRVVTTAGVQYIVDAFQNLTELENMKYHGLGTGSAAEAIGNTTLTTELTTQYSTSNTRPTGTTGEKSGDGNTYETTATITVSSAVAATEHGVFSQAATGGGVLLDRSVFAAVNLASGESIQATYQLTFTPGS